MNAAQMAAAAAASVRDKEPSETLHAVDRSTQLCACPSHGFWDSLDLRECADPDAAALHFKSLMVMELKHGRIHTLACKECFTPECFTGQLTIRGAEAGGFFLINSKAIEQRFWLTHCAVLAADLVVLDNAVLT